MKDLLSTLRERVIIGDGSVGATLFTRLGNLYGTSEEFNLHKPDGVRQLHRDYVNAGAELITTNTFTANRLSLSHGGLESRTGEINRIAVSLAREAAGDRAWVAGSVGPTGRLLAPLGELTEDEAKDVYAQQVTALAEAGADVIVVETMSALEEARAAVAAVRENTNLPVAVSFTIDANLRTMMGTTVAQFVQAALDWGADIIGTNCGVGPDEVERVLLLMAEVAPGALLWGEPNAGLPRLDGEAVIYDLGPDRFADYAERAVKNGARVVGSCCGSTPEHTRAMVERVRRITNA
jgi:methionine synthase I (cobalamin-dependent)